MNLQLRHSLVWQMIGPIPLMVIAAIAAAWFIVPRMISDNATNQAVLAGASIAIEAIFADVAVYIGAQFAPVCYWTR
jgi:low affinity Fe/Cu permease